MFTKESGEICDNWQLCITGFVYKLRISQGRNFYCVDKERLTPTCDTNYEKSCKFTLYPGTETPYTYEEFCLPNWEYKPYCELDSKSSKLKTFMEVYQEEIKKIDPTQIRVTEGRGDYWSKTTERAFLTHVFAARLQGAPKCVYDYFNTNYDENFTHKYFLE